MIVLEDRPHTLRPIDIGIVEVFLNLEMKLTVSDLVKQRPPILHFLKHLKNFVKHGVILVEHVLFCKHNVSLNF